MARSGSIEAGPPPARQGPPPARQGRAPRRSAAQLAVAEELLAIIASLRRRSHRVADRPLLLSSLTGSQLELVRLVKRRPDVSVAEAAEELHLAPNTVSTLVHQLTDVGYLVRLTDPSDRRIARLALAPAVRRQVDAWLDRRAVAVGQALERLAPGDRRLVVDALPALHRLADLLGGEGDLA